MFHEKVKETRMRLNMTQKQLADAAQIAVGSVSAYENGQKVPPVDAAGRIAAALGVSVDWLLNDAPALEAAKPAARSMGDVARAFLVMVDAGYLECSKYEFIHWNTSMIEFDEDVQCFLSDITPNDPLAKVLRLTVDNRIGKLDTFFEGVFKLTELVKHGTIDKDIYQTWLTKILEDLDKDPLPKA